MKSFSKGQRWVSHAEPELGLGILIAATQKRIKLSFDISQSTREYTLESAPVSRVKYRPGDTIILKNQTAVIVDRVKESEGLLTYISGQKSIPESELSDNVSFSLPEERLKAGMYDDYRAFNLRYEILEIKRKYEHSPARGFLGGQVKLIPHQFFIAKEVSSRYIPRVLLSDETGLGKTIEACLILHHLLVSDRIGRVLIIVPESLVHQWFVELYRKFKLSFRLFNRQYIKDAALASVGGNPFLEDQMGIISMDELVENNQAKHFILKAEWDMVVIDEIHHLNHNDKNSPFFQKLAQCAIGLMLLSATPEQMGIENHFFHLKLLDPEKYYDFKLYINEMKRYKILASSLRRLIEEKKPYEHILDSYGPGRVVFRNARNVIKGFPQKKAFLYQLNAEPKTCHSMNLEFINDKETGSGSGTDYNFTDDPRIIQLAALLKSYPEDKFLLICRSHLKCASIKMALENYVNINTSGFDETMTLMQRDRNAAWFADENGARLLICSEIGSEGRNFQFSRHLFLFDLPVNPEMLEQRIGRLDRIGQKRDILIHVPYVINTAYEVLARWFMEGLNLFEKNISGLHEIYNHFKVRLDPILTCVCSASHLDGKAIDQFIDDSKKYCSMLQSQLKKGKNILLELNSYKAEPAKELIREIEHLDKDDSLERVLLSVFDEYDIDYEISDNRILGFRIEEQIEDGFPLPGQSGQLKLATFDRQTAVTREDVDFYNLDHPYIHKVLDFFLQTGNGNCAFGRLNRNGNPGLLLDSVFTAEIVAPKNLQIQRFMPASPIRVLLDHNGNDMTQKCDFDHLESQITRDTSEWLKEVPQIKQELIPKLIKTAAHIANTRADEIKTLARNRMKNIVGRELKRLESLSRVNPGIGHREIELRQQHLDHMLAAVNSACLRLDSIRILRAQ